MAASRNLPRHLRATLGPDAGAEFVTILDEIRADNVRYQASFNEFRREVIERFDRVEQRLDRVEQRLDRVEQRLDLVERRLDQMDLRLDQMEKRMTSVEERFNRMDERFIVVLEKVSDVQSNLMKWSFVFWCGAVAAIAALAGVLK